MNNPAIIITGANGFIGNELCHYFADRHYKVFALARNMPSQMPNGAEFVKYDLSEEQIDESIFSKADFIIHCAYAKHSDNLKDSDSININGTKRLLELSRKHNKKKFIFLSSLSAHAEAVSHYGKTKLLLEKMFDPEKDLILKPGLVIGNGGLFKNIESIILKSKFIPLIGGGKQPVQTIYIDDLARMIQIGIEKDISGIYPVAETDSITMKEFYIALSEKLGRKNVFVPFPYWCAYLLIFTAGMVGIKIPISKENLLGLKKSRKYDLTNTLKTFGVEIRNYRESLDSLKL